MTTEEFIALHREDDTVGLALRARGLPGVDVPRALGQIAGWQAARRKLPLWASTPGITYPPRLAMEQCSSQDAAVYKAFLSLELLRGEPVPGVAAGPRALEALGRSRASVEGTLVDLTGGLGADFSIMAPLFSDAVYVERQEGLCALARGNLRALGLAAARVANCRAEEYVPRMGRAALAFVDPSRRDAHGARIHALGDCAPNLLLIMDGLLDRADFVMAKLSPMLDWRKAVADLGPHAGQVHIVSVGGECRELLVVLSRRFNGLERLRCVSDGQGLELSPSGSVAGDTRPARHFTPVAGCRIYEPNPSVMKAGCFDQVASLFSCGEVGTNSHLFASGGPIGDFPGRGFLVEAVCSMNKRDLRASLGHLERANITVRNFPLGAVELRRRLGLGDGGDAYLFATTLDGGRHVLLLCSRAL